MAVNHGSNHRVAYITDVFPGITLTFVYLEMKKLRQLGMEIDIYAIWRSSEKVTSSEAADLCRATTYLSPPAILQLLRAHVYYAIKRPKEYLRNVKLCVLPHPSWRLRRRTIYNFCLAPHLARDLDRKKTAHIHAHFASGATTVAMMATNLLGIGFSFTAHRGDIREDKALLREKLEKAKFAIAISEYNRLSLLGEAPEVEPDRVITIHCGVETNVFRRIKGPHNDPLEFLAVGSLLERKGHVHLIEACRLLKERGISYRCVIIGDGPLRKDLEHLIRKYQLERIIMLAGNVPHEDIQAYYAKSDIFILPSLNEGIPVVVMEAMSNGLPVIATRITGVTELVTHDKDGILVAPGDHIELAKAMMKLVNDRRLRKTLGDNARGKILADFDLDRNTGKIKKLFESSVMQ